MTVSTDRRMGSSNALVDGTPVGIYNHLQGLVTVYKGAPTPKTADVMVDSQIYLKTGFQEQELYKPNSRMKQEMFRLYNTI